MNESPEKKADATTLFFSLIRHRLKFAAFLLKKIPAAYFSGVRVVKVDEQHSVVSVPFGWFTQNPFNSTYFACLSMAAEMSTGVLAMAHSYHSQPRISMLVIANEARFFKKATGKTYFTCIDGDEIKKAIDKSKNTGEGQTITVKTKGYNDQQELVAEFLFTWSFKQKSKTRT